ncbi:MAG: SPOR domain-containing protein [Bacteroidota bacterium]
MNKTIAHILLATVSAIGIMSAQLSEQEIRERLDLIHSGKLEQVRDEVAVLIKQSPNDPAVRYLEAYVTGNGDHAVKKYQSIVDNFPQNEWADDALYKVYQYYYAVGLYKTAEAKMNQLNQQYPNSIFAKNEAKPSEVGIQQPAVEPKPSPAIIEKTEIEPVQPAAASGAFIVQVAVYSQEAKAYDQAQNISAAVGRQAVVFSKQSGGKTVYAVGFDGFADEQSAKLYGGELKAKFNLDWFVVKR